jgi:hypothetical protein
MRVSEVGAPKDSTTFAANREVSRDLYDVLRGRSPMGLAHARAERSEVRRERETAGRGHLAGRGGAPWGTQDSRCPFLGAFSSLHRMQQTPTCNGLWNDHHQLSTDSPRRVNHKNCVRCRHEFCAPAEGPGRNASDCKTSNKITVRVSSPRLQSLFARLGRGLVQQHQREEDRDVPDRKVAHKQQHSKRANGAMPRRPRVNTGSECPTDDHLAATAGAVAQVG